jgi:hypothetical protein
MANQNKIADDRIKKLVDILKIKENAIDLWFSNMEIRHFQENLPGNIFNMSQEYLKSLKLPFRTENKGVNPNSAANIDNSRAGEFVDAYFLSGILRNEPWRYEQGHQHGDILTLTTNPLIPGGYSSFDDGSMIVHHSETKENVIYHLQNLLGYNKIAAGDREYVIRNLWEKIQAELKQ